MSIPRSIRFTGLSLGSAVSLGLLSRAVAKRNTARVDRDMLEDTTTDPGDVTTAAKLYPLGKWWVYVPAAGTVAAYAVAVARDAEERRNGIIGATTVMSAALLAAVTNKRFDTAFPQPPAPPGREDPNHPVFPSGHAYGTTTVALTSAYMLSREDLLPAGPVFTVALALPAIASVSRMIERKHWASDVAGGFLAATALASLALAIYEAVRD